MGRKLLRNTAAVMFFIAAAFTLYALNNPQCSFSWSTAATYIFYGVYLILMAALFVLAFIRKEK